MNWDRIEGNWKQFKGSAMQQISKDESEKQLADWQNRMQESQSNDTTVPPAPR